MLRIYHRTTMNPRHVFFFLALYCATALGQSNQEARFEGRVFFGAVQAPKYTGSNEHELLALPLPYIFYRGETLHVDREGLRTKLSLNQRWEIDFSFSGSPPTISKTKARKGMNSLDPVGQAGPAIKYYFKKDSGHEVATLLAYRMAARFFFHEGPQMRLLGTVAEWNIYSLYDGIWADLEYSIIGSFSVLWSEDRLNQYIHGVSASEVRPERPQFNPKSGYRGVVFSAAFNRQLTDSLSGALFYRHENLLGTVIESSPLVKEPLNNTFGFAFNWTFYKHSP